MKFVSPSISAAAFNCPHCGAFTTQEWFSIACEKISKNNGVPKLIDIKSIDEIIPNIGLEDEDKERFVKKFTKILKGSPWIFENKYYSNPTNYRMENVFSSRCYNCEKLCIWGYDQIIFPLVGSAPDPNADLSEDVRRDYDEASSILDLSPRGACALIRLALQKTCKELGYSGKSIDADIKAMVKKGLDVRIQQSLDIIRVTGNNAVHPGEIDLKDDRATAESLFLLLNIIADKLISEPKSVNELFESLPDGAKAAIEKRDS
jgi:hypothetical protein